MRNIYLGAGHSNVVGKDRGAMGNGYVEGELAIEFRDLIKHELEQMGIKAITDDNKNVLSESIRYFKNLTKKDDIVIDIHWNAATPQATGTETLIPSDYSNFELLLAADISKTISTILQIPARGTTEKKQGVKTEADSHHGRLGWMRLTGENILLEVCFITNKKDMDSYQNKKAFLANKIAKILANAVSNQLNENATNSMTHTVEKGDTLFGISKKYNVSMSQIKVLNNLRSNIIKEGDTLKIM